MPAIDMSPTTATLIALALYAVALAPLVLGAFGRLGGRVLTVVYVPVVLAMGLYHTGIFQGGSLAPVEKVEINALADDQCRQVLQALKEGGVVSAEKTPRLLIDKASWDRLPEDLRTAITACLEGTEPPGANAAESERPSGQAS